MNKGFGFSAVALAFSLGALPFGSIAEEVPPPPPQEQPQPPRPLPPPQREMMHRGPHRGPVMPLPPMSEVDRAKFAELNEVIRDAMDDFRQEGSEANRAKLRAAVDAMVEARLKYDVEQAEKKLEFVKARLEKKAVLTERYLKRMTAEPRPGYERPGKPGPCPVMDRPGKGCPVARPDAVCPGKPGPKGAPAAEVRDDLAEAHKMLRKAEAGSAEAKAAVTGMNTVFKRALERVDRELAKAKEAGQEKETAELEQAKKMLTRMAERTADPEKYLEAMKNRPAPRKRAEKK